jgi:hypothetical protein
MSAWTAHPFSRDEAVATALLPIPLNRMISCNPFVPVTTTPQTRGPMEASTRENIEAPRREAREQVHLLQCGDGGLEGAEDAHDVHCDGLHVDYRDEWRGPWCRPCDYVVDVLGGGANLRTAPLPDWALRPWEPGSRSARRQLLRRWPGPRWRWGGARRRW